MVIDIANEPIPVPLIDQTDLPAFATTQQVNVGDTIKYTIMATSQNFLDSLFVSSGLFDLSEQPAIFNKTVSTAFEQSGDFFWIVDESHVREEEYSLAVQIIDDNLVSGFYLVNFEVNDIGTSTAAHPEEEHDIIIYSNPVKDVLNIKSKSRNFSDYQIFDMLGTLMIHGKLDGKSVGTRLLPSGSYVLLIDGKYSLQFIKVE